MYGITEREVLEVDPTVRPSFLARLGDAGDARSRGEDVDALFPLLGAFPELAYRDRTPQGHQTWLSSYLDDLLTRDAATVHERKDSVRLCRYFETVCLHMAGMPTDLSLYQEAGVPTPTAALSYDWLLESLYVVTRSTCAPEPGARRSTS